MRFVDTVCQPTKQRQNAAVELGENVMSLWLLVAPIAITRMSWSTRAAGIVRGYIMCRMRLDLRPEWFRAADTVGITAGTSTRNISMKWKIRFKRVC